MPNIVANPQELAEGKAIVEALYGPTFDTFTDDEFAVAHAYEAGRVGGKVGGDVIDLYRYDNDSIGISLIDICGHGTTAALHAGLVKYATRAYASHGQNPETVLRALNVLYRETCRYEKVDSFLSIFFGIIPRERNVLWYASAGHDVAALISTDGTVRPLLPTGPLVGVSDDNREFNQAVIPLSPGDIFFGVTDGLSEARSPHGGLFGTERATEIAVRRRGDLDGLVADLLESGRQYSGGAYRDDVAILAARLC
jgi:sigma-B regulation protein RsbU (phosphoserine phosphatase)